MRTFGDFVRKFHGPHKLGEAIPCPNCGSDNLHHYKVTIYDRPEDAPDTFVTEFENAQVTQRIMPSDTTRNPSSRRGAVVIDFWCESFPSKPELTIEQHKARPSSVGRMSSRKGVHHD